MKYFTDARLRVRCREIIVIAAINGAFGATKSATRNKWGFKETLKNRNRWR
jgi:hypothetical protein